MPVKRIVFHDVWAEERPIATFPTLQLQCLYYLAGRLEEYSSETLALLPVPLRRQLLLHLPIRDVCRLGEEAVFMNGIDPESIWRDLIRRRITLFSTNPNLWESLEQHPSAKDAYMTEVSLLLLTRGRYYLYNMSSLGKEDLKSEYLDYFLFGIPLKCEDELSLPSFLKHQSLGFTWLTPKRYEGELGDVAPLSMVNMFLSKFNWYPKRLDLREDDLIDEAFRFGNIKIFQSFVSHVETIRVRNDDYRDGLYGSSLEPLWQAVASSQPSSLASVSLSACVTNLAEHFCSLIETVFTNAEERVSASEVDDDDASSLESEVDGMATLDTEFDYSPLYKFGGLKKLEVLGNDAGTHPHEYGYTGYVSSSTLDLANFINYQVGLETLVIEGFEDIVKAEDEERYGECDSSYDGFESFYNYLPHVILKPSFMFLQVASCHIPLNAVKNMISTFLNSPTSHDQTLEIRDCQFLSESTDTFPKYPLIKQERDQCICGEHKSLSIQVNHCHFSPQWLFEYPNLRLKQLELSYRSDREFDLQCFDVFPTAFIDTVCCSFYHVGYEIDAQAITKLLELPSLSEVEFVDCTSSTSENGLLSLLTTIFAQQPFRLTSLRRLHIGNIYINSVSPPRQSDVWIFRSFFDAFFSMPTKQLSEITLEFQKSSCYDIILQQVVKSWEAKSKGQKIQKLVYFSYYRAEDGYTDRERIKDIAISTDIAFIL